MSAQSRLTSRCDVAHSGQENLHQFPPILLWRHAPSSSIMTLWSLLEYHIGSKAAHITHVGEKRIQKWPKPVMTATLERFSMPSKNKGDCTVSIYIYICLSLHRSRWIQVLITKWPKLGKFFKIYNYVIKIAWIFLIYDDFKSRYFTVYILLNTFYIYDLYVY